MTPSSTEDTADADPLIGSTLQGRYRVVRLLGAGGMGAVYEGEHLLIKRRVAIKFLHPEYARNAHAVGRFRREALAATSIGHENIIEVTDMGTTEDGAAFIVLEYLRGKNLDDLLDEVGPLPIRRAIGIVEQICSALTATHEAGIIHRDLKPDNVMLIERASNVDFVKILDFGVSKIIDASAIGGTMTKSGMMMGTPLSMAPEQFAGAKNVDARSDIYALGVILFRLLTGQYPFADESLPKLILMVATAPPPPLSSIRSDIPAGLEDAASRMLAKEPGDRFATCADVIDALRPYSNPSTPAVGRHQSAAQAAPDPAAVDSPQRFWTRPGGVVVIVLATLLAGAAIFGAVVVGAPSMFGPGDQSTSASTAASPIALVTPIAPVEVTDLGPMDDPTTNPSLPVAAEAARPEEDQHAPPRASSGSGRRPRGSMVAAVQTTRPPRETTESRTCPSLLASPHLPPSRPPRPGPDSPRCVLTARTWAATGGERITGEPWSASPNSRYGLRS